MTKTVDTLVCGLLALAAAYNQDPVFLGVAGTCIVLLLFLNKDNTSGSGRVNRQQGMDKPKVVNKLEFKEVQSADKNILLCRCWKSPKFPYCDGKTHNEHNKETGDNVGPLVIVGGQVKKTD